jgi:ribosome-associated protein
VVILDVRELSPVTDFFVIGTGTSARQMRTVVDDVEELAETRGSHPISRSGIEGETWMLVDFVDVIVHVFNDASRQFYDLDNLWGDAPRIEWQEAPAGATR